MAKINEAAIDTMKPNSMPDTSNPKSKLEVLADVIGDLASVDKETWAAVCNDFPSVSAAGRAGPDAAEKNRKSIAGHLKKATNEAIKEMFDATGDLTEEFKEECARIFEHAINARANLERICLEEAALVVYEELHAHVDECLTEMREAVENGELEVVENEQVDEQVKQPAVHRPSNLTEAYIGIVANTKR